MNSEPEIKREDVILCVKPNVEVVRLRAFAKLEFHTPCCFYLWDHADASVEIPVKTDTFHVVRIER